MKVIDVHAHYAPSVMLRTIQAGGDWYGATQEIDDRGREVLRVRGREGVRDVRFRISLEERIAAMDACGTDVQVLSVPPTLFFYDTAAATALAAARESNDDVAATVQRFPTRFSGIGTIPMQDVPSAVSELERLMTIGLKGVALGSNINGRLWDLPDFEPLFEAAERLGALLFFHSTPPVLHGDEEHYLARYHFWNTIEHPVEDTIAGASLIFGGVLQRHPDLKVVIAHGGGNLCFGIARMERGWHAQKKARVNIDQPPSSYLRGMYYDSITWGEPQLRFLIDQVGADRIVVGSDWPADMGPDSPRDWLTGMDSLSSEEKELITHGNIERLIGI